jgi:hypothetical protein
VTSPRAIVAALTFSMLAIGAQVPASAQSPSAPSPDASAAPVGTPATLPPDGSWQVDLSADELAAAGATGDGTRAGVFTWTFGQGLATIDVSYADDGSVACAAVMQPEGDLVRLSYSEGACGDEQDAIRWVLEDDGLHLTLVSTNAPFENNRAYLEAKPWQPVETPGAPPDASEPASSPSGT